MEKVILFATLVTILFGLFKFVEMKYIDEEMKPMKLVIRDVVIVFGSAILGGYAFILNSTYIDELFSVVTNTNILNADSTQIFTGNPDF
jgi:hypothetical protein